ncbi:cytochrome P450 [Gordonia rhizosphera]|uniref:Putative cytochrome P450 n=1 Tax=Gordonia rhizosphera NBRC 16068 TaxID=1108045 RepID=K6VWZ0_9ACTN|nr:cytochrome P450 [Gordonia rhizosphera]GAB91425.1 putative cytochrome P450 [Gordonia rhizosphera NBRC 16068]
MTTQLTPKTETRPDVDLADGAFYADREAAHSTYRWMRENEPVFVDRNGLIGIASHEALMAAERAPEIFCNAGGTRPGNVAMPFMMDMDDPEHLKRRKLVSAGFSRNRVRDMKDSIADLCDTIIDGVAERGECDFVRDVAAPLPMAVIGDMLGVPESDHALLLHWSDTLVEALSSTITDEQIQKTMNAFAAYSEYMSAMITDRQGTPRDDLVSIVVHARIDGDALSDEQMLHEALLLLVAGDETTRHALTGGVEQLLRTGEYGELVSDPSLIPTAVEEMLRWSSPVKNIQRTVTSDVDFFGTRLRAGDKCLLLFESANFDGVVFDDPDTFDLHREPNNHVAFGFGRHFCLGNQLARVELNAMMERLTQRIPDLRLADEQTLPLRAANFVSGLERMPVAFALSRPVG